MHGQRFLRIVAVLVLGAAGMFSLPAAGKKEPAGKAPQAEAAKPVVAVSIIPQAYFVKRIAGEAVSTLILVGPGQSPHTYEPTPRQMEELSKAKAWIRLATEFDDRLSLKVATLYPNLSIVDGTLGVKFRSLKEHEHEHEHGKEEEHKGDPSTDKKGAESTAAQQKVSHEMERDRHTWLGREPAKILAAHVRDALIKIVPDKAGEFKKNHDAFVKEIDTLFDELKKDLAPLKGKAIYVYHPAFGYFLDEFEIVQEAVETGGKEPNPQTLAQLIQKAKEDKVKVIFVQAQFPTQAAQTLARELNAQVVPLNPLAENWLENIRRMGEALVKAAR